MRLNLIGPPGSGKGTQAEKLEKEFGVVLLSSGNILRKETRDGTPLGLEAKKFMDAGKLLPEEVVINMYRSYLDTEQVRSKGYILDGFTRTLRQAHFIEELLVELGMPFKHAVAIVVPDEVVIERLAGRRTCTNCGATYHISSKKPKVEGVCDICSSELISRADDEPQKIQTRLDIYHEQTAPLLDFYRDIGKLVEIQGDQDPSKVYSDITGAISG